MHSLFFVSLMIMKQKYKRSCIICYLSFKFILCLCMLSCFSCVRFFVSLGTVAHQAPLSMKFSRQEHWSGMHALLQGIPPTQGLNPCLLRLVHCRQILYCWAPGEFQVYFRLTLIVFRSGVIDHIWFVYPWHRSNFHNQVFILMSI